MVDIIQTASDYLPTVKVYGNVFISTVAWIIYIVIAIGLCIAIGFWYINRKTYKHNIVLFEEINGRWVDVGKDKAREMKFGDLGGRILYCKQKKKYLPFPQIQSGYRKFYYKIRGDGQWENFELHSEDKDPKKLDMILMEKDMRYANVGIREGLKSRYDKPSFWQQYGTMIISAVFILIVGISVWLWFDKMIQLSNSTNSGVEVAGKVMEKVDAILGKMENICVGGKGYVPAG